MWGINARGGTSIAAWTWALASVSGLRFMARKSAANEPQMSRAALKPLSEEQGSVRDGEAPADVPQPHGPAMSQPPRTPCAVPVGGLMAPGVTLWLLAKSPHPKGHPLLQK